MKSPIEEMNDFLVLLPAKQAFKIIKEITNDNSTLLLRASKENVESNFHFLRA